MKYLKLLFIGLLIIGSFSCEKDAPPATDATLDKGHQDTYKAVFRFSEGEEIIENGKKYFETIRIEKDKDSKYPIIQEYILENSEKGLISKNKRPILLEKGKLYSLEVLHYNKRGELINHEFTTPEMAPIHQHFFMPGKENEKDFLGKKVKDFIVNKDVITYYYRDTQPYNKMLNESGVTLRDWNDPIGLKGYFSVNKKINPFDLKVILVHVIGGTKLDDKGNPDPFHSPDVTIVGTTDISVKIPIEIFTSIESPNYKKDISEEFNIPLEDIEKVLSEREKLFENSPKIKF